MLKKTMLALRVTDMEYAPEICGYLKSAEKDLQMAGIIIQGTCDFVITEAQDELDPNATTVTVEDNTTITDDAVITAMLTYCRMHFGSPADYDRLADSYDLQRKQLANATGYTDFLEEDPSPEAQDDTGAGSEESENGNDGDE